MGKVSLKNRRFLIDGKDFFVYSGEIHYFRIDPKDWPDRLKKAKEMGFNTVASYSPWGWHEYEEGKYDFTGKTHPRRNFLKFVKEVEKAGLYLIARIGPVSNGEMCYEGVPGWMFENYPEVRAKNADGSTFQHGKLVSYSNDKYLLFAHKWYDQILPLVEKNLYTRGGRIILVQLCNEIGMINWIARQPDYDSSSTQNYRDYLNKKYKNIDTLNKVYGTSYRDFDEIKQPTGQDSAMRFDQYLDWHEAYRNHYASYYEKLANWAHGGGVNVPIQANIPHFYDYDVRGRGHYSPMTTMLFKNFTKQVGEVVFGGAYQIRRLDYDNCQDIPLTTEMVRMISHKEVPLVCAEMQTGIMRDYPRLYPQDVDLNLKTSTAQGLNGLNCYMLCGGTNPEGVGHFGPYHEWQAPIDSKGNYRVHAETLKDFGKWTKTFGLQVSETEKVMDLSIGFYAPYYETDYLTGALHDRLLNQRNKLFYDGLVRLIHLSNYGYNCLDLERATVQELLEKPALCVFSLDFMDEATQEKLVQYVKKGGKLILNPCMPLKDLAMNPCTKLADGLGVKVDEVRQDRFIKIGPWEATIHSDLYTFKKGGFKTFATSLDGKPCGIQKKVGSGQVIFLGGGLTHEFEYHIDIMQRMLDLAGLKPALKLSNPLILGAIRTGKTGTFLFLFNYHEVDYSTKVEIRLPGKKDAIKIPASGEVMISHRTGRIIPIDVNIDANKTILYTTAEIISVVKNGSSLKCELMGGGRLEMKLKSSKPKEVKLGGTLLNFKYEKGILTIQSQLPAEKSILELIY